MSASADATQLAIERALDHAGVKDADDRRDFTERFYCGEVSEFEQAAVQSEFNKITRADIGRAPLSDIRERVLDITTARVLDEIKSNDSRAQGTTGEYCQDHDQT